MKGHRSNHSTYKALPHGLVWKIVGQLLLLISQRSAQQYLDEGSLTSRLNNTPPIGDPKATEIPAAAAADKTSRFRAAGYVRIAE